MLAQCVFWVSGACVAYSYVLYPGFIYWAARFWGRSPARPQVPDAELPTVTLLIAAHNEESVIAERIENSLNLDYPAGRLEVVVALDGCSDRTAEIVRNYESRGVRVLDNPSRQGKAATLNAAIARLTSEILILSDANTSNERSAARRLVSWFADLRVGVVCGRLILTDPRTGRNVDSLYWRYETFLKRCEATLGALLGANGAIYAIRRSAFVPLQPNTIIDDFVIPLQSKLRTGCSIVYDAEAIAWEETPARLGAEFGRRARIGAGAFQSLRMLRPIFHPCQGWLLLSFVSHKLLRWFCPLFLLALFMATVPLVDRGFYCGALVAQIAFYGLAIGGLCLPGANLPARLIRLQTMFCSMNLALAVGFWRYAFGRQHAAWRRTERTASCSGGHSS